MIGLFFFDNDNLKLLKMVWKAKKEGYIDRFRKFRQNKFDIKFLLLLNIQNLI